MSSSLGTTNGGKAADTDLTEPFEAGGGSQDLALRGLRAAVPSVVPDPFDKSLGWWRGPSKPNRLRQPSHDALVRTLRLLENELRDRWYDRLVEELQRSADFQDRHTLDLLANHAAACISVAAWKECGGFWLRPVAQLALHPTREQRVVGVDGVLHLWPNGREHIAASAVSTVLTACDTRFRGTHVVHACVGDWASDLTEGVPGFWARCSACERSARWFEECEADFSASASSTFGPVLRRDIQRQIARTLVHRGIRHQLRPDTIPALVADAGASRGAALAISLFQAGGERSMALLFRDYRWLKSRAQARHGTSSIQAILYPPDWSRIRDLARRMADPLATRRHEAGPLAEALRAVLERRLR